MKKDGIWRNELEALRAELDRRFSRFMDTTTIRFSPVFVVATFLDPRYKPLLSPGQKEVAIQYLKRKVVYPNSVNDSILIDLFCFRSKVTNFMLLQKAMLTILHPATKSCSATAFLLPRN